MARTIRKGKKYKGSFQELWSRRPLSGFHDSPENRTLSRRIERKQLKAKLRKELREVPMNDAVVSHVKVHVHPHHPRQLDGPYDVRIGITRLPPCLRSWAAKCYPKPLFLLDQPDEKTNLTCLILIFDVTGEFDDFPDPLAHLADRIKTQEGWHTASLARFRGVPLPKDFELDTPEETEEVRRAWKAIRPSGLSISLKARHVRQLTHPMPTGQWGGACYVWEEHPDLAIFILQGCTHRLSGKEEIAPAPPPQSQPRTILLPGDEGFQLPPLGSGW